MAVSITAGHHFFNCFPIIISPLQYIIKQIARQNDEECNSSEEYADKSPCHYFLQQGCFRQRKTNDSNHEGYCCSDWNTFRHKHLNYRYDTCGIGIHRYGKYNRKRYCIPVVFRHILLKESFRYKSMHESTDTDTNQDVYKYTADNLPGITDNGRKSFDKGDMIFFPFSCLNG